MIRWLNKQGVESDEGFAVQRMHRFYYHYIEENHIMKIDVDPGGKYEDILLSEKNRWEPPHENEMISDEKREEIRSNVSAALTFMKIHHCFRSK